MLRHVIFLITAVGKSVSSLKRLKVLPRIREQESTCFYLDTVLSFAVEDQGMQLQKPQQRGWVWRGERRIGIKKYMLTGF